MLEVKAKESLVAVSSHSIPPWPARPVLGTPTPVTASQEAPACPSPSGSQESRAYRAYLKAGIKQGTTVFDFLSQNSP